MSNDAIVEFVAKIMNKNMYITYIKNDPIITDGKVFFDNKTGFVFRKNSAWEKFLYVWWYNAPTPSFIFETNIKDDSIVYKIKTSFSNKPIFAVVTKERDALLVENDVIEDPPEPPLKIKGMLSFAKIRKIPLGGYIIQLPNGNKWKARLYDKKFSLFLAETNEKEIIVRI